MQKMADKESELYQHNLKVLNTLDIGDLVEFEGEILNHWGVYVGNGYVIHLVTTDERESYLQGVSTQLRRCSSLLASSGSSMLLDTASCTKGFVWKQRFFSVADKKRARKKNFLDGSYQPLEPQDIVTRAESWLDENQKRLESKQYVANGTRQEMSTNDMNGSKTSYDLFRNNCEHFATWCRYGVPISEQAERAARLLKSLDAGATVGVASVAVGAVVAGAVTILKWMLK